MFWQLALLAGQFIIGEATRPRPKRIGFEEFKQNNAPSEIRPIAYGGGTFSITPSRIWYGDFTQRAVERDSHWSDYLFMSASAFLLDTITVAYRYYVGEGFVLCFGPDTHVERITIGDRLMFQAPQGTDNAGGGFLLDDPQAWGGDQPPGEGGIYTWVDLTRGNYTDPTNAYIESLLTTAPNKTPSLRGVSSLWSRGRLRDESPMGFEESGYFAAGGIGFIPRLREWDVVCRRQPDNLATGFNKVRGPGEANRRHMNPAEVIYEWSLSDEYGARAPIEEINLDSLRSCAETLCNEDNGWSGKIEQATSPRAVIENVLRQIDAVFDPSPSLGMTLRLIRRDYSFGSLRVLNRDLIHAVSSYTPGTYEDTISKIIVPFFDPDNNFTARPGLYVDTANVSIQGRTVPQTQDYLGVGDFPTASMLATRDGRALSIPRAAMTCEVLPSFGRLAYQGEVVRLEWESPTFTRLMRVLSVQMATTENPYYELEMIEDQFATGIRTGGEPPATEHEDPGAGLDIAPPSATWNEPDFPPDGLRFDLVLTNTNQFQATITGGIVFGTYAPGGQYARLYVTEPGGVQTLSPARLLPDANNEATFSWPGTMAGTYEFCVQTYSLFRDATNGVKVCADIVVAQIGSPSASPSSSVSPSPSPSISPSASESPSVSPSVSPSSSVSASTSASPSASQSPSASMSPSASASASISPSASVSPSASASPSGAPAVGDIVFITAADHESDTGAKWPVVAAAALSSGITDAHGKVYQTTTSPCFRDLSANYQDISCRVRVRMTAMPSSALIITLRDDTNVNQVAFRLLGDDGSFSVVRNTATTIAGPSATGLWTQDNWYTIELKAHIADSPNGSVEALMYNDAGTLLGTISATGIDSQNTVNAYVRRIGVGSANGNPYVDDVSVDGTGELHGTCQVDTLLPNGAGDLAAHTRGGADSGANWSQCDENPDDSDTSYVQSTGVDQDDCYAFSDMALSGDVRGLQVTTIAKLAGGASRQVRLFVRIGGVTYLGAITHTLTSSFIGYSECWTNNPATGNAWSSSEINAAQFGVRSVTTDCRHTQVAVEVLVEV